MQKLKPQIGITLWLLQESAPEYLWAKELKLKFGKWPVYKICPLAVSNTS